MGEQRNRLTREIGKNTQKIINYLMDNDNLINLLWYTDQDPLSQTHLTKQQKKDLIFNKLIKLVPRLDLKDDAKSSISIFVSNTTRLGNEEFRAVEITIEVFVPITQWIMKDSDLRPYAIMGEIQDSLDNRTINGLGKIKGGDFDYNFGSNEMTAFIQRFTITSYD